MNRKELYILSIGVFLTMVAFVVNTLYHIENGGFIDREILPVSIPSATIDGSIFPVLNQRQ